MNLPPEEQLERIRQHTVDLIPEEELLEKLRSGRSLRVKLGVDPSGPDIHLGHAVVLRKLRLFQDLGHVAVLIIGDFTGMIGDPSGRSDSRPQLTREQIAQNMAAYRQQVFKILDPEKTEFHYNSEWLGKLTPEHIIRLASTHTVAQLLARDDFAQRYQAQQPISLHEFLYPIFQGYDSIAVRADVEIGGTDQKFNFLVARELQEAQTRGLVEFATVPTARTWARVIHAGAALTEWRNWIGKMMKYGSPEPGQEALASFWAGHSKALAALVEEHEMDPSVPLPEPMLTDLRFALYDYDPIALDVETAGELGEASRLPGASAKRFRADRMRRIPIGDPQCIITFPLLVGSDGVEKMGKSLNNYIGITEPPDEMFGKIMSIPDEVMEQYFELCTDYKDQDRRLVEHMKAGTANPRDVKFRLAHEIVEMYHGHEAALAAQRFERVFSGARQQTREDYEAVAEEVAIPDDLRGKPVWISTALVKLGLAKSRAEAARLIKGGGVYLDERRLSDPQEEVELKAGMLVRVGKRRVARLVS